jgi:hypothetical protein
MFNHFSGLYLFDLVRQLAVKAYPRQFAVLGLQPAQGRSHDID